MRLPSFAHNIAVRFTPINEAEAQELYAEAFAAYRDVIDSAKVKIKNNTEIEIENRVNKDKDGYPKPLLKLTTEETWMLKAEKWYMRYAITGAYMILSPMIDSYVNGTDGADGGADTDDDDDMAFLRMYMTMKKQKNSKL